MGVVAFIYARMDSNRLPGKALMNLSGSALIDIVIDRVKKSSINHCVLLTTVRKIDDNLVQHALLRGVQVIRGNSTDLVKRTLQAISETNAKKFIRVNADSPLIDPVLLDFAIKNSFGVKMVSNLFVRNFPYGVGVEVIESEFYKKMSHQVYDNEREHVTQHLYRLNCNDYSVLSLEQERDDSHIRLAIDTQNDYQYISKLLNNKNMHLSYWDIFKIPKPLLRVQ